MILSMHHLSKLHRLCHVITSFHPLDTPVIEHWNRTKIEFQTGVFLSRCIIFYNFVFDSQKPLIFSLMQMFVFQRFHFHNIYYINTQHFLIFHRIFLILQYIQTILAAFYQVNDTFYFKVEALKKYIIKQKIWSALMQKKLF